MIKREQYMNMELILHCNRVRDVCDKLYNGPKKELLLRAAEIHDIGKYYISDKVLNSPRALTVTERMAVDTHSMLGFQDCRLNGEDSLVCRLVLFHHGVGKVNSSLVNSLMNTEVAELFPYLMAADIYSAIREERVYHPKKTHLEAVAVVNACRDIPDSIKNAVARLEI